MKRMILLLAVAAGMFTTFAYAEAAADKAPLSEVQRVVLTVHGLSCPLCAHNLDGQLLKIKGVEKATIDLDTGTVDVRMKKGHAVTRKAIEKAVDDSGFSLKKIEVKVETES